MPALARRRPGLRVQFQRYAETAKQRIALPVTGSPPSVGGAAPVRGYKKKNKKLGEKEKRNALFFFKGEKEKRVGQPAGT